MHKNIVQQKQPGNKLLARILLVVLCITCAVVPMQAQTDSVSPRQLDEVVVTANAARQRMHIVRIGAERLELAKMAQLPAFGGEKDIIKSITLLPGVRSEGDGGGGFEVRGGSAYQNLVQMDGISLYNPAHVMGIFSTFNDDAIGAVTLYKGPIPAMYGGATSSVLETALAAGDMQRYHASATVGILAAKIKAEGPIVKDKLSFALAARRSYVDAFLQMVPQYRSTIMNFYDASARLSFIPSQRHSLDASFFISRDNMAIKDLMGLYWGNMGASVNWQAYATDKLQFTTTAAFTHFDPEMVMEIMDLDQAMWTYIRNYSVNEKIRWSPAGRHNLEFGLRSELLRVKSAEWLVNKVREREIRALWTNSVWAEYTGAFADKFDLTAGARLNIATVPASNRLHSFPRHTTHPYASRARHTSTSSHA